MPGIVEGTRDPGQQRVWPLIFDPLKILQGRSRICLGVNRLNRRLAMLPPLPVDILHVLLLNVAAIQEHGAAEVSRGRGADNLAPEPLFHQVGEIARMINVGVR